MASAAGRPSKIGGGAHELSAERPAQGSILQCGHASFSQASPGVACIEPELKSKDRNLDIPRELSQS